LPESASREALAMSRVRNVAFVRRRGVPVFFLSYMWSELRRLGEVCVLTLAGDRIKEITAFRAPAAFASFDLPETLGGERRGEP
jgi:hypothetical protein